MKKLINILLLSAALIVPSRADNIAQVLTANVATNLLSVGKILDTITLTATTTNMTTARFYDTSNATTNIVRMAYTNWVSYATNFNIVFTNEADLLVTNTFDGIFTGPTTVAAVTNSRPAILTIIVPPSDQRTKVVKIQTVRGLAVQADQTAIVEVDYRGNP